MKNMQGLRKKKVYREDKVYKLTQDPSLFIDYRKDRKNYLILNNQELLKNIRSYQSYKFDPKKFIFVQYTYKYKIFYRTFLITDILEYFEKIKIVFYNKSKNYHEMNILKKKGTLENKNDILKLINTNENFLTAPIILVYIGCKVPNSQLEIKEIKKNNEEPDLTHKYILLQNNSYYIPGRSSAVIDNNVLGNSFIRYTAGSNKNINGNRNNNCISVKKNPFLFETGQNFYSVYKSKKNLSKSIKENLQLEDGDSCITKDSQKFKEMLNNVYQKIIYVKNNNDKVLKNKSVSKIPFVNKLNRSTDAKIKSKSKSPKPKYNNYNNLLNIHFHSDKNEKLCTLKVIENESVVNLINRFFSKFPLLLNTNHYFTFKGNKLDYTKTILENNLSNNSIINIVVKTKQVKSLNNNNIYTINCKQSNDNNKIITIQLKKNALCQDIYNLVYKVRPDLYGKIISLNYNNVSINGYKTAEENKIENNSTIDLILDNIEDNKINYDDDPKDEIDILRENYKKIFGHIEFEEFNKDGWKEFYSNDSEEEEFFNWDKGEVQSNQKKIFSSKYTKLSEIYEGDLNYNSVFNGYGKFTSQSFIKEGQWRNGQFTGWGRIIGYDGEIYEGKFIKGRLNGKGIYKDNKIKYKGDFINSIRTGKGELETPIFKYEGEFKDNHMDGQGHIFYKNKNFEYFGSFEDNEISGHGTMKWNNGDKYMGSINKGKMEGRGEYYYSNGQIYKGFFKDGQKNGKGKLTYPNGKMVVGNFVNGLLEGEAKLYYKGLQNLCNFKNGKIVDEK